MKTKILVIEDEEVINDYVSFSLSEKGYSVVSVANGEEAIEKINKEHFHIIISDILMKPVNGYQVLEFLKENNMKIPVIMLSALDDNKSLMKCYDLGAIDYLTKPVNKELLIFKVKILCEYLYQITSDIIFDNNTLSINIEQQEIKFTKTEYEIFRLLYNNSPRVYTKDKLIEIIWCNNEAMSEKIVDVNIFNIRKKLGKYSHLVKTKRMVGYSFENKN